MTNGTIANEVKAVRERLDDVRERLESTDEGDTRRGELTAEEQALESRLQELKDQAGQEAIGRAELEASDAADIEHVPDIPERVSDPEDKDESSDSPE